MRAMWVSVLASVWIGVSVASITPPDGAQRVLSDNSGRRFFVEDPLLWIPSNNGACDPSHVCLRSTASLGQEIDGFGGSFMRAGAGLLNQMSAGTQDGLLEALFDPELGAGLTLGKVPIGATDFGVPVWYTYEDVPGNFSIDHDLHGDEAVLPFVKRAQNWTKGVPLWLQATMDYPPDYMMNTTTPFPHTILNTTMYGQLAQYYLNTSLAYAANGVPIRYLSMFNEPYSSYITPTQQQIIDLLVGHVGPLFRQTPAAPNLTWGEQYGRMITLQTGPAIMEAPGVKDYVDILFYHGYDCGDNGGWSCGGDNHLNTTCPHLDWAMGNITAYKAMYPSLKMWMTEVCYAIEFSDYPPNTTECPPLPRLDFEDGLQWGRMIVGDMQAGASGWVYWNLFLNMSGGPYLFSPKHNDPWNNIQQPLVVLDPDTDGFHLTGCYYFLAHFGRFVKRGMHRVVHQHGAALPPNVHVVAFTNEATAPMSGPVQYVVQWMNDGPSSMNITLQYTDDVSGLSWTLQVPLPPISITTTFFNVNRSGAVTPTPGPPGQSGLGKSTIAGILGGVCGGALLFAVAVVVVRRRLKQPEADYIPMEAK